MLREQQFLLSIGEMFWTNIIGTSVVRKKTITGYRRLREADVVKIKKHLSQGKLNQRKIARMFNISYVTINKIKMKSNWKNI